MVREQTSKAFAIELLSSFNASPDGVKAVLIGEGIGLCISEISEQQSRSNIAMYLRKLRRSDKIVTTTW